MQKKEKKFVGRKKTQSFQAVLQHMTEHGATMTCTILFVVSKRAHKDIVLRALNVSRERVHHRKVAGAEVAQISLGPNRCFAVTVCQSADPNARLEKVRKLHAKVREKKEFSDASLISFHRSNATPL